MATYSIGDLSRREILKMSAILGVASVASNKFAMAQAAWQRTPEQILGPFYPLKSLGRNADREGRRPLSGLALRRYDRIGRFDRHPQPVGRFPPQPPHGLPPSSRRLGK